MDTVSIIIIYPIVMLITVYDTVILTLYCYVLDQFGWQMHCGNDSGMHCTAAHRLRLPLSTVHTVQSPVAHTACDR
jgi:hypothetical protein